MRLKTSFNGDLSCGPACGCGGLSSGWSPSHPCRVYEASHPCGLSDEWADLNSWWSPSHTYRAHKASRLRGPHRRVRRLQLLVKPFPHRSHLQGFSPVWSLWWRTSSEHSLKSLPHWLRLFTFSEGRIFSPGWPPGLVHVFPQSWWLQGFSSVWALWWRWLATQDFQPQTSLWL